MAMGNANNSITPFETRDFGTAFCLLLAGEKLSEIQPAEGNRVVFIFAIKEKTDWYADGYLKGHLTLHDLPNQPVIDAYGVLRSLKQRLHAVKNANGRNFLQKGGP